MGVTVNVVNVLTPGHRHGREYPGSTGADEIADVFASGWRHEYRVPDQAEITELQGYAARLYTVFAAVEAGDADRACASANALMADANAQPVLARHGDEPWHLHFHAPDADWVTGWVAGMATSLAVVLGGTTADRLGVCSARACDRVFADASRNGSRRFCSTACQNRAKAAAFRVRRRKVPQPD